MGETFFYPKPTVTLEQTHERKVGWDKYNATPDNVNQNKPAVFLECYDSRGDDCDQRQLRRLVTAEATGDS